MRSNSDQAHDWAKAGRDGGSGVRNPVSSPPDGLTVSEWQLCAIFAAPIFAVVTNALPILAPSVLVATAGVLTGVVEAEKAHLGFAGREARRAGGTACVPAAVRHELFLRDCPAGLQRHLLFAGSGYLSQGDLYRLGAMTTASALSCICCSERRG